MYGRFGITSGTLTSCIEGLISTPDGEISLPKDQREWTGLKEVFVGESREGGGRGEVEGNWVCWDELLVARASRRQNTDICPGDRLVAVSRAAPENKIKATSFRKFNVWNVFFSGLVRLSLYLFLNSFIFPLSFLRPLSSSVFSHSGLLRVGYTLGQIK